MMAVDDMRPVCSQSAMVDIKEEQPPSDSSGSKSCPIHSGHFMVSRVHDVNNEDDNDEEVASPFNDDSKGFDFFSANKEIVTTYNFSNANTESVGIDASLTKLFECMTLAYSGKITSPRWKQFRGMHLTQKQRIRLNNLIWREWHMQYIYGKLPIVCQFATPLSDHIHSKPEAVVLEGKYWKRQLDTVTAEYKKWRRYFKERIRQHQHINFLEDRALNEAELLERVKDVTFITHSSGNYMSNTDLNLLQTDVMDMDFTNELFANLNQPFIFPNPRELSQLGYADFIQPGLVQLQPNLEEFMDIDSMQEFFSARMQSSLASQFVTDSSTNIDLNLGSMQSSDISLENFLMNSSGTAPGSVSAPAENIDTPATPVLGGGNNTASFVSGNITTSPNIMLQLTSGGQYQLDPATILLGTALSQGSPQTFTIVPSGLYNNIQNIVNSSASTSQKPVVVPATMSSSDLLTQLLQQQQQSPELLTSKKHSLQQSHTPIQPAPSLNQRLPQQRIFQPSISSQSPILAQSLSIQHHLQQQPQQLQPQVQSHRKISKINKVNKHSGSSDNICASSGLSKTIGFNNQKKKDGPFTIPTAKPVIASRKIRVIAPAPPIAPPQQTTVIPSPSSQASYLAELLKNGTYPGALISVKKEPQLSPVVSSPIKTTTNLYQQMRSGQNPIFSQHIPGTTMVTAVSPSSIQTNLPSLTSTTIAAVDASLITNPQDLTSMIMSSSLANRHSSSSPVIKESTIRFSHAAESKVLSPVNLLPKSPVASPPLVKRTPSPIPSMDASSFVDPLSPFSSSMPMSPSSLGDPESPGSGDSYPFDNRRAAHLSAEQKRRCNLKTGFDMLQQLVPSLSQNPKVSKATMLQKTAEYCKKLKVERAQMQKEATILKQEINTLNIAIGNVQSQLPETGVPVTRQRKDQMKEMFDEYVRIRTNENSKFWIFSVIMNTLFDSYCNTVSTASIDELCRTSLTWLDQSCSLVNLRPSVLNALRKLSTSTPILTEPQRMKEHALLAVAKQTKGQKSSIMMTK